MLFTSSLFASPLSRAALLTTGTGETTTVLRAPHAFDIPASADPNLAGTTPVGARWERGTVVTAVALTPSIPAVRSHHLNGTETLVGPDRAMDLAVLQAFRGAQRIPLTIDLTVTDIRYCGAGPIATAFGSTLGSLPVATARRVVVVLRLPAARIHRSQRGESALAVLRTSAIATRRLAALLGARGTLARVLRADDLREHTDHLLGPGLAPPHATESPAGLTVDTSPTRVSDGLATWRTFALRPDTTAAALRAARVDHAVSTTTVLRLSGAPDSPALNGVFGVTEVPGAGRALRSAPVRLDPLTGHQDTALRTRLPLGETGSPRLPDLPADPESLRAWRFRLGDDGPLIGADQGGHAVTVPLLSSTRQTTAITGDRQLVALLLQRCIGAGAAIGIRTGTPQRWTPMLDLVDDPGVLALGPAHPGSGALVGIDLLDESSDDESLRIRLRRTDLDDPADSGAPPWFRLEGCLTDASRINLAVGDQTLALTGVAGPSERELIAALATRGRPAPADGQKGTRAR